MSQFLRDLGVCFAAWAVIYAFVLGVGVGLGWLATLAAR